MRFVEGRRSPPASAHGRPIELADGSILWPTYCESASAPNRVYVVRIRVNDARNGIEFLPM